MGYKMTEMWTGTGYNKDVRLKKYVYDDSRVSWEFRDRKGSPSNPTEDEAVEIIRRWRLTKEVQR